MRRILSSLYILGTLLTADPQWAPNYIRAFELAKAEGKGVMVMLTQDNCKACWYMENIVFEDETLVAKIEASFIPLSLDVHDDDIHGLDFSGTPTFYFLTGDDRVIKRLDGVYNIKEMTAALLKIEVPKKEDQ